MNPGGGDKGINVSSIMEPKISITIHTANCYEYVGRSIDTNIIKWSQIKYSKYLIKIQNNWSNPYSFPELRHPVPFMKLLYLIHYHLWNKLGDKI